MTMLDRILLARARSSPAVFAELAMVDERTGAPIRLAPHHRAMFRAWTSHRRTVQLAPSEFGKSGCAAVFIAWSVGRDPSLRVGLLSATAAQAERLLRLTAIVMSSPGFARVFPSVRVERSTATEIMVSGRPPTMKDANVFASAFDLSSMYGARFDVAACDDIVTGESTRTLGARDAAYQAFLNVTASRIAPDGVIHVVNTAEHTDDIPHRLARLPGWRFAKYPALDASGNPTWPERWPLERIEARKHELGPIGFQRAMLCEPVDASSLIFQEEDLQAALARGRDPAVLQAAAGGRVVIGVDPAWTTTASSDESGIVCVSIDSSLVRHVFHVEGRRMHHDALIARVVEIARANKATVYCESNAAGHLIAAEIGKRVPCKPLTTSASSKRARVEALSAELASQRWVFRCPNGTPSAEMRKLIDELSVFDFDSHMGDRASALMLACEGARLHDYRPKGRWLNVNLSVR